jgi:hypothetical protein
MLLCPKFWTLHFWTPLFWTQKFLGWLLGWVFAVGFRSEEPGRLAGLYVKGSKGMPAFGFLRGVVLKEKNT